jgi:hypothetical protein
VPMDMALFDLGLDSLTTLELKGALETSLDVSLQSSIFFDYPTLSQLSSYLLSALQHSSDAITGESSGSNPALPNDRELATDVDTDSIGEIDTEDPETREKLMKIAQELAKWDDIYSG